MTIKQISVYIENKKGRLAEATRFIADHKINLRALSIADSQDFGILRLICENPVETNEILREGGYLTRLNNVLAVKMEDRPGSLADILEILAAHEIDVEYTYAFLSTKGGAYMVFRVTDNAGAAKALEE
ncbi:MAG: ACT domain-containing protein, partial [Firmicutes bacterium]|nr:ACT domain-containing protein [Bacillota bacterium]